MISENTNEGETSNTVTENAPDMNEFQQESPVEETAETTNEITEKTEGANENEIKVEETEVNETVKEVQETSEAVEKQEIQENTIEATETQEVQETTAETTETQEVQETTAEVTDAPEATEVQETTEEVTNAPEVTEDQETTEKVADAPEVTEVQETKEEVADAPEATEIQETTEEVADAPEATNEQAPEVTEIAETADEAANEGNKGDNHEENVQTNNADEPNKESLLVEEVTMTTPIGNVDNEFSEMDGDLTEHMNTEELPIKEISQAPEEPQSATEMNEEQTNLIPNEYYSSVNGSPTNRTSVKKPVGVENYKFSSEPRAIPAPSQRRKYRDPYELEKMISIQKNEYNQEKQRIACNIMYDPRVVRGNTYAAKILPLHSEPDPLERHKQEEMKRRAKARKRAAEKRRIKTPEPVEGRRHVEIQTDLYLEELYDKVPEAIAATQTDLFLDRAPSPLYIPQKSGVDAATQIYDGELFDFNFEVEPILEVLVGKTLEQALIEVMEEEELEMLRKHQVEFEEKRNAELAEVQRLEDAERRRTDEKNRRVAEKLKLMKEKKEVAEKIAARSFTNAYLSNLIPSVFETLNDNGFFYDPRETEIENYFLPWLTHKSNNYVDKIRTSRLLLDHIILNSIKQLNDMGRPILRGLKERKIKKPEIDVSVNDWLNPYNTFKCVESKPSKY